jgi:8-oxo-dGTP pyrophosphatase MutT (NUDIX family)
MPRAAGIVFQDPGTGRVLLIRRSDTGDWDYPGGLALDGEPPELAAIREAWEEVGFRAGHSGKFLCRRVRDGTDYVTFHYLTDEFVPRLDKSHTAYIWMRPRDVLPAAKSRGR